MNTPTRDETTPPEEAPLLTVEAKASKHKAMSYARMADRQAALEAEIGRLLAEVEALDRAEEQQYGRGRRGDELPAALQDPVTRRVPLREVEARLEAEHKRELAAQKQAPVAQIKQATQALEPEAREQVRAAGQPNPDAARPHDLCPSEEDHGGTRLRPDQGPRLSPLFAPGRRPGEGRIPLGVRRPQRGQTVANGQRDRPALACRA